MVINNSNFVIFCLSIKKRDHPKLRTHTMTCGIYQIHEINTALEIRTWKSHVGIKPTIHSSVVSFKMSA